MIRKQKEEEKKKKVESNFEVKWDLDKNKTKNYNTILRKYLEGSGSFDYTTVFFAGIAGL